MAAPVRPRTSARWPKDFRRSDQPSLAPTSDFVLCPKALARLGHRKCSSSLQLSLLLWVMGRTWSSPIDEFGQVRGEQPDGTVNTNPGPEWTEPTIDAEIASELGCSVRTLQWVKADAFRRHLLGRKGQRGKRGLQYKTNIEMIASAGDYTPHQIEPEPEPDADKGEGKAKVQPASERFMLKPGMRSRPMTLSSVITRISCSNPSSLPIALSFHAAANGTLRVALRTAATDEELRALLRTFAVSSPGSVSVVPASDGLVTPQDVARIVSPTVDNTALAFEGEFRKVFFAHLPRYTDQCSNALRLVQRELVTEDMRFVPYLNDRLVEKHQQGYRVTPLLLPLLARDFRAESQAWQPPAPSAAPTDQYGRPISPPDRREMDIAVIRAMIDNLQHPEGLTPELIADAQREIDNAPADIRAAALERISRP